MRILFLLNLQCRWLVNTRRLHCGIELFASHALNLNDSLLFQTILGQQVHGEAPVQLPKSFRAIRRQENGEQIF